MFNVGGGEVLVILMLALVVIGPDKLPEVARQAGKHLSTFRSISQGFHAEFRDAIDNSITPARPTGEPASSDAADPIPVPRPLIHRSDDTAAPHLSGS